jgi:hypothetical protein
MNGLIKRALAAAAVLGLAGAVAGGPADAAQSRRRVAADHGIEDVGGYGTPSGRTTSWAIAAEELNSAGSSSTFAVECSAVAPVYFLWPATGDLDTECWLLDTSTGHRYDVGDPADSVHFNQSTAAGQVTAPSSHDYAVCAVVRITGAGAYDSVGARHCAPLA